MKCEISRDGVHQITWYHPVIIVLLNKASEIFRIHFNDSMFNAINSKEMIERLCL